ncbi:MAG: hypothetical protein QOH62_1811, partial [Solirubrobacteraceae bacterium]|nr:hypothetical protein [Solirubrobacteraceae bacterium]
MPDVVMPRLSDSMEEGTILKWLKAEGDQVERGEELVEIETDKATMPYEADTSGTLHIIAAEGDTLPIGQTIATIGEASPVAAAPAAAASKPEAAPVPARTAVAEPAQAAPAPAAAAPPVTPAPAPGGNGASPSGERVKASPVARRIARERGVYHQAGAGPRPGGRVVKAHVEGAQPPPAAA